MIAIIIFKSNRILWSGFNFGFTSLNSGPILRNLHLIFCLFLFGGIAASASAQTARFFSTDNKLSSTLDRKSTRLNSSHVKISYAVFCLKKKNIIYMS